MSSSNSIGSALELAAGHEHPHGGLRVAQQRAVVDTGADAEQVDKRVEGELIVRAGVAHDVVGTRCRVRIHESGATSTGRSGRIQNRHDDRGGLRIQQTRHAGDAVELLRDPQVTAITPSVIARGHPSGVETVALTGRAHRELLDRERRGHRDEPFRGRGEAGPDEFARTDVELEIALDAIRNLGQAGTDDAGRLDGDRRRRHGCADERRPGGRHGRVRSHTRAGPRDLGWQEFPCEVE